MIKNFLIINCTGKKNVIALNINNNTNSSDPNYLGNKAHYPVLLANVDQNGWINSNYIDKFGWSIFPYQASLQEEYQVLLQDLSSVSASQWYVMPSLFTGDNQLRVWNGSVWSSVDRKSVV